MNTLTELRIWVTLATPLTVLLASPPAQAFNSFTHDQITRSAFAYLATYPHLSSATDRWLAAGGEAMVELLAHAAVDADYESDIYLGGLFHQPFAGAMQGKLADYFTTFSHHLNVTTPGVYWPYDGYAYRHTSGTGNDSYLATPTAFVDGEMSKALASPLPGFRGTAADWNRLYFNGASAADAVFPPANVPAQQAFDAVLASPRAEADRRFEWDETSPLVESLFSNALYTHHFVSGEVRGLPAALGRLGLTMHLIQDMGVPQHTEGTADHCHPELEARVDAWTSASPFYDAELVTRIRAQWDGLRADAAGDPAAPTVGDRLVAVAKISARWQWGEPTDSVDFLGTVLPDGTEITGDTCAELLSDPAVQAQARYQYNLAVAATALVFELAARAYEGAHPAALPTGMMAYLPFGLAFAD